MPRCALVQFDGNGDVSITDDCTCASPANECGEWVLVITENALYSADAADALTALVGGDKPNGDFAEDVHFVSGYVGFGVTL